DLGNDRAFCLRWCALLKQMIRIEVWPPEALRRPAEIPARERILWLFCKVASESPGRKDELKRHPTL
ncbi:MAG: hypothetical protein CVV45_19810, partial [Spirochaetae bacterium HGW-Spirochaetae-10]